MSLKKHPSPYPVPGYSERKINGTKSTPAILNDGNLVHMVLVVKRLLVPEESKLSDPFSEC